ncbi:MAG TPA: ribosomal protein S18-alanine N-acetyltransferase [Terriglobales bacterium]
MHIRPATTADVAAMRRIEAQAPTAAHWSEDEYDRIFAGDPPRLAIVIGDTVQGFLIANQIGPEWELENIAVAAGARRRGLASALLGHFLAVVKQQGGDSVFLEVRASNAAARAFYAKYGFAETGRRRHYYQHPDEDAVLYRRVIGSP